MYATAETALAQGQGGVHLVIVIQVAVVLIRVGETLEEDLEVRLVHENEVAPKEVSPAEQRNREALAEHRDR